MSFEIGQEVLVRHPNHRCSLIGTIQAIEEDQAYVKLHIPINNNDEYWFELRNLRRFVK